MADGRGGTHRRAPVILETDYVTAMAKKSKTIPRRPARCGTQTQESMRHVLCERHFWILACSVVLLAGLVRLFDFSLTPLAYRGLFITRPFCGLHNWDKAHRAWAARSHVKYGLGYTKGR